jgi:O-antigen ligase
MLNSTNSALIILACSIMALPLNMTLSGVFLIILIVKIFIEKFKNNKNIVPDHIKKIWLLFIIFSLVQGIFAINPLFHYAGLIGHYLLYWLIFYLVSQTVKTPEQVKKIIKTVAYSGTLLSLIGILAYSGLKLDWKLFFIPLYGGDYLINLKLGEYLNKASGFSMNPNNLGSFLLLSTFMSLSLFAENIKLYPVLIFIQSCCLILTGSRGAIGAFIAGIVLYLLFRTGSKKVLVPLVLGFLLIFIFNFSIFTHLITTITDPTYSSNSLRISVWKTSLEIIKDFPMGVGILNYENIYPYYLSAQAKYLPHAHNWYLHTCIESGVIGAVIFLLFISF